MITGIDLDLESNADGNRMLGELYPISDVVPGIKKPGAQDASTGGDVHTRIPMDLAIP